MDDFAAPPGAVEGRLVRDKLPPEVAETLESLKEEIRSAYGRVSDGARRVDPTLERTVESARNAALGGMQEIEKKIVAALKRTNETLVGQLARARAALFPTGEPQGRGRTCPPMPIRYRP